MIDRYKLISRHNPHYIKEEKQAPLSVGNGGFCFTSDFTGLQTFFGSFNNDATGAFPLCTMAEWGWHRYADAPPITACPRLTPFDTDGRTVGYAVDDTGQQELFYGLRRNAHKFHLGLLSFTLKDSPLIREQCEPIQQTLNLWTGTLISEFIVNGEPVRTETFVHPYEDSVYIKATSPLIKKRILGISLEFPYASHRKSGADFAGSHLHTTSVVENERSHISLRRIMDETKYYVTAGLGVGVSAREAGTHRILFEYGNSDGEILSLVVHFGVENRPPSLFADAETARDAFWQKYWTGGGAIAFSDVDDPRAAELERRLVLSQYVTAIQCRGELPPAETGLSCNSWYGKFHLEMLFWHTAHFALWGRIEEVKNMLAYCRKILPVAKRIAASQGYAGARLPKMCDPSGENTPSSIAVLLLWQQPHPIMLIELCYRADPSLDFLREYRELIVETAEFMRDFLRYDKKRGVYILGPPYIPAQERHDPRTVLNAPYELEYFRWALMKADEWLERLGEKPRFGDYVEKMVSPAYKGGVYLAHENCPNTFSQLPFYTDHPSMLAMFGVLNSGRVDKALMSETLDKILDVWNMESLYGWDFPMMAMTACRLGRYEDAVNLLLMDSPKNTYLPNGHNRQEGDAALPLYLPGNGGLLLATAMLAAGFDGNEGCHFPKSFNAEVENIHAYI